MSAVTSADQPGTEPLDTAVDAATRGGPTVVLTGFMGTGKSTVGALLAERIGLEFLDTDAEIERRHGPIPAIFAEHGEAAFRAHERELAHEIAARRGLVVATGGGFVVDARNVAALADSARIFCLVADADEIVRRVTADTTAVRPLLAGDDPAGRVRELLAERRAAYGAYEQVPTDRRSPEAIVDDILVRLGRRDARPTSDPDGTI